ncbi:HNH endonuclease family protein [Geodermatophilus sp. SYSU D00815]
MSRRRSGRLSGLGVLVVALLVLAVYLSSDRSDPTSYNPPGRDAAVPAGTLDPGAAAAALEALPVAAKGTLAGYERDCGEGAGCVFGPAWSDVDRNGCDQRNDVLHRDLTGVEVREGTGGCTVVAGVFVDPYTGEVVEFRKDDASEVPVDHVVPLAAAWTQGAAGWTDGEREAFANDLGNLLATTRAQNSAKGDSTAEEWVPPDPAYGCEYASVVVTVKQRYELSVTAEEAAALRELLATC